MGFRAFLICCVGVTLGAAHAGAQDLDAAKKLYADSCRNCHGPSARGMASFPKLAGQNEEYLQQRLEQYRDGESVGPNSALMFPIAAEMSDDEIANVASYIATTFK